jgi:3-hydroxyacyl-[acyl-carrier protein] dehydratase/trans-2-decenoyl-[acyl-carrier protein] isomerase
MNDTPALAEFSQIHNIPVVDLLAQLAMQGINIQLPVDQLSLLKTVRTLDVTGGDAGKGEIVIEMPVDANAWFFKCHFPGDPIMPGCLGIEGMWQSTGVLLAAMGHHGSLRALGIGDMKLMGEVRPHHKMVTFHMTMDKCKANKKMVMAVAKGVVKVDGEEIYRADKMKVGIIYNTG